MQHRTCKSIKEQSQSNHPNLFIHNFYIRQSSTPHFGTLLYVGAYRSENLNISISDSRIYAAWHLDYQSGFVRLIPVGTDDAVVADKFPFRNNFGLAARDTAKWLSSITCARGHRALLDVRCKVWRINQRVRRKAKVENWWTWKSWRDLNVRLIKWKGLCDRVYRKWRKASEWFISTFVVRGLWLFHKSFGNGWR